MCINKLHSQQAMIPAPAIAPIPPSVQFPPGILIDHSSNPIGESGEDFFKFKFETNGVFHVSFLGEKAPDVDCLLTFKKDEGNRVVTYPFLVQIKTSDVITPNTFNNISTKISNDDVKNIAYYYLPTYLARVDKTNQKIYMWGIYRESIGSSIKASHIIANENGTLLEVIAELNLIIEDVMAYWQTNMDIMNKLKFNSKLV